MNIYFVVNESGVNYWRGKVPGWELLRSKKANVKLFNIYDYSESQVEREMGESDVIYIPCANGIDTLVSITQHIRQGKSVVVDYDDNLFDCHPFNPAYSTLGLYEVTVTNSDGSTSPLWKDQRHGFSLDDNRKRFYAHIDILNTANQITTTTTVLRDTMLDQVERDPSDFNVVPNSIDFNVFKPFEQRRRDHSKIRIGWAASDSHIVEGRFVARVLKMLRNKRQDFEFVILGNLEKFRFIAQDMPIEWHEFTDLSVYPLKLASLEFDIGIIPLENHTFNLSKSALKWSEYSAMKIPSVMSDLDPYNCVRDGIDGMKAHDEESFVAKIEAMMDDASLRRKIANNAYERNRQDFNIETVADKWLSVFEKAHIKPHQVLYKGKPLKPFDNREMALSGLPLDARRSI